MELKEILTILAKSEAQLRVLTDRDLPEELLKEIFFQVKDTPGYQEMVTEQINALFED